MFPTIKHISDLTSCIEGNPQFRIDQQANGFTVVCYMLKDEDTFAGADADMKAECRGITFDAAGNVASRALHKFPNVGEGADSQPHLIPWERIKRVMDKRDGSMVTPVLVDGRVVFKTKKSFTSAEAIAATEYLYSNPDRVKWVALMLQAGQTPIFEWTSPRFPIVLVYERDELTLLHVRNNTTGAYRMDLEDFDCPFPTVENLIEDFQAPGNFDDQGQVLEYTVSWEMLHAAAMERTGIEGWIAQADDGRMWKIKTKWYVDLHRQVVFSRWRDLARSVVMDQSDDLKASFSMVGRSIEPILHVERTIKQRIETARCTVEAIVTEGRAASADAKSMALRWKGHELFGQIMSAFRGKELNWMEWYEKFCLEQDFSNEVIPSQ